MKTVLITGGNGVLAQYFKQTYRKYTVLSPGHIDLDVTKRNKVSQFFNKYRPNIVIHTAAKIDVDNCEKNPEQTFKINALGTKNVALSARKYASSLIYISTAAVFEGNKKSFTETDTPNPINIYGKSKLAGEKYIQDILSEFIIIRAAWLIGGGKKEKKFVSYILQQINNEEVIKAVDDKIGTISYAKELADFSLGLVNNSKKGIYHFGSKGACSRYQIAKKIVSILGVKKKIIPVNSDFFTKSFYAPRPNFEVLKSKHGNFSSTWQASLQTYIQNELLS